MSKASYTVKTGTFFLGHLPPPSDCRNDVLHQQLRFVRFYLLAQYMTWTRPPLGQLSLSLEGFLCLKALGDNQFMRVTTYVLTIDPNFLGHPSGPLTWSIIPHTWICLVGGFFADSTMKQPFKRICFYSNYRTGFSIGVLGCRFLRESFGAKRS